MTSYVPHRPGPVVTPGTIRLLAIGGSTRPASGSTQALIEVAASARAAGASATVLSGRDLMMPMYEPDAADRSAGAREFLAAVRAADALVICSPGYHGTVSGMVKNALDYLEDLSADQRPYLNGIPVGCVAVAHGWQAAVGTLHALRTMVHALRGWPSPLGVAINAATPTPTTNGRGPDEAIVDQLSTMTAQVIEFALARKTMTQRSR